MYFCKECGNEYKKWYGKCPACKNFNTIVEVKEDSRIMGDKKANTKVDISNVKVEKLNKVSSIDKDRFKTNIKELDRVLGGGFVEGSLTLLGGAPGVGKSTLTMDISHNISKKEKILYVSGEESVEQIKLRAQRIIGDNICDNFLIANVKNIEKIQKLTLQNDIKYLVIDSIQTIYTKNNLSLSGSISQLKESTLKLMYFAKENNITIIAIGHITKDGEIAGPKLLEHMVDTVLYLEGEKNTNYKILRSQKNRFGKVGEIGIFEMKESGMDSVDDLEDFHLQGEQEVQGIAYGIIHEGARPLIIEVQSLIVPLAFGYPKRTTQGYSLQRLNLLLGLMQKRLNMDFSNLDCYLNLSIYLQNNSYDLDLAVIASLISSKLNKDMSKKILYLGEVSLTGEVRRVDKQIEKIQEAQKLKFEKVYCNMGKMKYNNKDIQIIDITNIKDLIT